MSASLNQRGSVLIESLIAILIFSIGLLAMVGLQADAIKNTSEALYRAQAGYLAEQIIGFMWADRDNLSTYANHPTPGTLCAPQGPASTNTNVLSWLNEISSELPNAGAARQSIDIGNANLVTVTVCWQPPQDPSPHLFTTTAQIGG
ncbi:MAG: type IV pilus modification protein PilV [Proteobacteria bacterium]|nr:type IV pilus modification protein PilV [Pseudomonadota bacterium]MDE3208127.1 type IV pilus modification protein PilV [Pseudomonadota bacterium]